MLINQRETYDTITNITLLKTAQCVLMDLLLALEKTVCVDKEAGQRTHEIQRKPLSPIGRGVLACMSKQSVNMILIHCKEIIFLISICASKLNNKHSFAPQVNFSCFRDV